LDCLTQRGDVLDASTRASEELSRLQARLAAVQERVAGLRRPTVAAIEWLDPVWPAGHWVPEQIGLAGGVLLLAEAGEHTNAISWNAVVEARPEVLLLMPCGLPPERTEAEVDGMLSRPGWADLRAVRSGEVWVLDGPAYFNRPGPRVVRGVEILAHVLHGVSANPPIDRSEARRLMSMAE
jgi:iron complex transport system substrate-binding protein